MSASNMIIDLQRQALTSKMAMGPMRGTINGQQMENPNKAVTDAKRRLRPRTLVGKTAKTSSKPQMKLQQVKQILRSDFQLSVEQQTTKQRSSLRLKQQQDRKTSPNPSN